MRRLLAHSLLIFLTTWLAVVTLVAGSEATTGGPSVDDLAWITGDWVGGEEGTLIEEQWSPPASSNMMGMFRMIADGELRFYEFMSIEQEISGPVLRIKHYDSALVGWEERNHSVVLPLEAAEPGRAVFESVIDGQTERLIYERTGDRLMIILEKPAKDSRTEFRFRLRKP